MDLSLSSVAVIGICLFLIFMFLRMPIGVAMLLSGFIGIWLIRGLSPALSSTEIALIRTASNHGLSVIPLYILMGVLAGVGGVSKDAFSTMDKWVGHLRGGLAIATTCACCAFGAVCGSNVAAAATMCSAALPEMRKYRYSDELSLGCIASGGNLGIMIPPSTAFIIYGFITETSIGALFIAGILPGLLLTFLFCIQIYVQCRLNPQLAPLAPAASWKERLIATKGMAGILVVFIIVIGGIYAGFFTPTEAGAVGAVAAFALGLIKKQFTWRNFIGSLIDTAQITAMIMLLIIGAKLFSSFLTLTETPTTLASMIEGLAVNRYVILVAVLIFYVITGFFMDIWAILIVSLPIVFPMIVLSLGFDALHLGVLAVLTIIMGSITPPFGVVVFSIYGMVREVPLYTIFRGCMPFVVSMVVCLVILVAFPQISVFLPNLAIPYR